MAMRTGRWTPQETEYLRKNYPMNSRTAIATALGRHVSAVSDKIAQCGGRGAFLPNSGSRIYDGCVKGHSPSDAASFSLGSGTVASITFYRQILEGHDFARAATAAAACPRTPGR